MRKLARFHPFQLNSHKLADGQTHVAAQRFYGVAHFIWETAGFFFPAGAAALTADTGSGGQADAPRNFLFPIKQFFGKLLFVFAEDILSFRFGKNDRIF